MYPFYNLKQIEFILIILYTSFVFQLHAQNTPIKFKKLTINDGLSQSTIHCIMQDSKGFLWFGTQDGLNKFDGYDFTIYKKKAETSMNLSNVWINDITEDHNGNILLATRKGLNIINILNETISHYLNDPDNINSLSHRQTTKLIECNYDSNYEIWVGTVDGLNMFNYDDKHFDIYRNIPGDSTSLSNNNIKSLYQDRNKKFWIGTSYGLSLYNKKEKKFIQFINNLCPDKKAQVNEINEINEDNLGNLLIGTGYGLFVFLTKEKQFISYNQYLNLYSKVSLDLQINCILNDNNKNLWIGTSNGLFIIDVIKKKVTQYLTDESDPFSLSTNYIYDIFKDSDGSFWVGTYGGGVNIYHSARKKFTNYRHNPENRNSLNNNDILSIYEDDNGLLWIGTFGGGVNCFDRTKNLYTYFLRDPVNSNSIPHNSIRCINKDKRGNMWFGTDGGGISMYNVKRNTFTNYQNIPGDEKSISYNNIRNIKEDSKGIIWIGTAGGGLNKFDFRTQQFTQYVHDPDNPNSIGNNFIYNIFIDESDNLLIGSDGGGIITFDTSREIFTSYVNDPKDPYSICNNYVLCIHKTPDGIIWIGTDIGLSKFNIKERKFYDQMGSMNFPNTMIYGILEDSNNNLWLSSNEGIIRFNYNDYTVRQYDVNDGIQSNEFWGNSYYKNRKGEFFFGGINGFTVFYPDSIHKEEHIPHIYFLKLSINNQPVMVRENRDGRVVLNKSIIETDEIILNYKDRFFSINYIAPNYINSQRVKFAYKMEGFDIDWHYVGNTRFANYTNLPPGKYLFKVKVCNEEGEWSKHPTILKIIMQPPFWKTWWFISIMLTIIISSISYWYWNKLNQIRERNILLEEKVKERTKEIVAQKEEIAVQRDALVEANATKDKFFSIISHDLRSPFNSLLGFGEVMLDNISILSKEKMTKYIGQMYNSSKQLYSLVENLLEWSRSKTGAIKTYPEKLNLLEIVDKVSIINKMSADKKSIQIAVNIDKNTIVFGDVNLLSTILRNLISNALKYSQENSSVVISSKTNKGFAEVSVTDSGTGIKKEDLGKLFREDVHFTKKGTKQEKGTGLGLILCKEFVEKNGGKIWVESEEGEGSTFTFTIPIENRKE